jgi:ATP-dependent DNA helicase RecQ
MMQNSMINAKLNLFIKKLYGEHAEFRDGQLEAILSVISGNRTLVVQKTGWGKSLVYFLATKIMREESSGVTIVISPLLSLMNNQQESAAKIGLKTTFINYTIKGDTRTEVIENLIKNKFDVLFITPETLLSEEIQSKLIPFLKVGLLVVDEAHCISDWGHDFRLDYTKLIRVIKNLPPNIPILATTATANDRVIEDIKSQFGNDVEIIRGDLTRESIHIQVIELENQADRYAWIVENIHKMPGSGIIYCLTVSSCNHLAEYLIKSGINAYSYHADLDEEEAAVREKMLQNNQIKVLVATVKLGMGYDKDDIGFVIHFQKPGNVVSYYQQIGRAGRNIPVSYAILLCGKEDDDINNYFIESAFPSIDEMSRIIDILKQNGGMGKTYILRELNIKYNRLEKALGFLEKYGDIYYDGGKYYKTSRAFVPNIQLIEKITAIRRRELMTMNEYIKITDCYMQYIARKLDDHNAKKCCKCANCIEIKEFSNIINERNVSNARAFIKNKIMMLDHRRQWANGLKVDNALRIPDLCQSEDIICLSSYGDSGWGTIVRDGKYRHGRFDDILVEATVKIWKEKIAEYDIKYVVPVPSLRHPVLVPDFARRVAEKLEIKYVEAISKNLDVPAQKNMENSFFQCKNTIGCFKVNATVSGNILLIDDMVDSKWTLTSCAYILRKSSGGKVYPFALANTRQSESEG